MFHFLRLIKWTRCCSLPTLNKSFLWSSQAAVLLRHRYQELPLLDVRRQNRAHVQMSFCVISSINYTFSTEWTDPSKTQMVFKPCSTISSPRSPASQCSCGRSSSRYPLWKSVQVENNILMGHIFSPSGGTMTYSSAGDKHLRGESEGRLLKVLLIAFYLWL